MMDGQRVVRVPVVGMFEHVIVGVFGGYFGCEEHGRFVEHFPVPTRNADVMVTCSVSPK